MRRLLDAVLCLALAIVTGAQPTTAPLPVSTVSQIDSAVAAFMTRAKAPGLSLAVGEDGRLALDDTVGKWLPEMPEALRPITVTQLLSHQSGIRHCTTAEDDSTRHYPGTTTPERF